MVLKILEPHWYYMKVFPACFTKKTTKKKHLYLDCTLSKITDIAKVPF
uniref:Uncharacterized protein n=1 Tax=Lepeophtheirus salmonis TaxID=72036 RepID=A0A0K2U741_LEPSM